MKTCIKIYGKNGEAFIPTLQFEYSDIQEPVVIERDDMYVISYYRELGYDKFEIYDPWPRGVHCDIVCDVRGYCSPQHICGFGEDENLRFEDVKKQLPNSAYVKLNAHCHGDIHWYACHNTARCSDAILYVSPEYLDEVKMKSGDGLPILFGNVFTKCLRFLNGDQLYEHVTIEIDKKTHEHDEMGMVAYLWEEECTAEGLRNLKGEVTQFDLIDIEELFTFY